MHLPGIPPPDPGTVHTYLIIDEKKYHVLLLLKKRLLLVLNCKFGDNDLRE